MRKLLSRIDHQEYTAQLERCGSPSPCPRPSPTTPDYLFGLTRVRPCRLLVENGVVDGEEGLQKLRATWWLTQGNTPESLST